MTIDEIVAALQGIVDGAQGRDLNDEEMKRYEELEVQLATAKKSQEIRSRQEAYTTPVGGGLQVMSGKTDDTLERAFEAYIRTGVANQDIVELRAQAEGTGSAGGYLVPDGFRQKIVERLKAYGGIQGAAETLPTASGNPIEWPTVDDTANDGEIVAENGTFAAGADVSFGTATLGAYKYMAGGAGNKAVKVSWELLQDSAFDVEGLLSRLLADRIGRIQAQHLATGTGTGQPQGLVTPQTAYDEIASNTAGPTYGELVATVHAIDPMYRGAGCSWVMNDTTLGVLQSMLDGNDRPIWLPSGTGNLANGLPDGTLLGYPVVIDQAMPSIGDQTKFLAFGNIQRAYVVRRVKDITMVALRELYAESGQTGFMAWARMDARVQDLNAYAVLAGQNT